MKPSEFIHQIDEQRVLDAIARAERGSSGEIRLFIAHGQVGDPLAAAATQFHKLGMANTQQRNGVLLFFAPKSQRFAIVGDAGINAKCGTPFWQGIVDEITPMLVATDYTGAIVAAVDRVGAALAHHFPSKPDDRNELPDRIERG